MGSKYYDVLKSLLYKSKINVDPSSINVVNHNAAPAPNCGYAPIPPTPFVQPFVPFSSSLAQKLTYYVQEQLQSSSTNPYLHIDSTPKATQDDFCGGTPNCTITLANAAFVNVQIPEGFLAIHSYQSMCLVPSSIQPKTRYCSTGQCYPTGTDEYGCNCRDLTYQEVTPGGVYLFNIPKCLAIKSIDVGNWSPDAPSTTPIPATISITDLRVLFWTSSAIKTFLGNLANYGVVDINVSVDIDLVLTAQQINIKSISNLKIVKNKVTDGNVALLLDGTELLVPLTLAILNWIMKHLFPSKFLADLKIYVAQAYVNRLYSDPSLPAFQFDVPPLLDPYVLPESPSPTIAFNLLNYNMMSFPYFLEYTGQNQRLNAAIRNIVNYSNSKLPLDFVGHEELWDGNGLLGYNSPFYGQYIQAMKQAGFSYHYNVAGVTGANTALNSGLAAFSRWPIVESDILYYDGNLDEDCLASKGALHVRVRKPVTNDKSLTAGTMDFNIFVTHPLAGDRLDIQTNQLKQMQQLADWIASKKIPASQPVIIMGDMNINRFNRWDFPGLYPKTLQILNADSVPIADEDGNLCPPDSFYSTVNDSDANAIDNYPQYNTPCVQYYKKNCKEAWTDTHYRFPWSCCNYIHNEDPESLGPIALIPTKSVSTVGNTVSFSSKFLYGGYSNVRSPTTKVSSNGNIFFSTLITLAQPTLPPGCSVQVSVLFVDGTRTKLFSAARYAADVSGNFFTVLPVTNPNKVTKLLLSFEILIDNNFQVPDGCQWTINLQFTGVSISPLRPINFSNGHILLTQKNGLALPQMTEWLDSILYSKSHLSPLTDKSIVYTSAILGIASPEVTVPWLGGGLFKRFYIDPETLRLLGIVYADLAVEQFPNNNAIPASDLNSKIASYFSSDPGLRGVKEAKPFNYDNVIDVAQQAIDKPVMSLVNVLTNMRSYLTGQNPDRSYAKNNMQSLGQLSDHHPFIGKLVFSLLPQNIQSNSSNQVQGHDQGHGQGHRQDNTGIKSGVWIAIIIFVSIVLVIFFACLASYKF